MRVEQALNPDRIEVAPHIPAVCRDKSRELFIVDTRLNREGWARRICATPRCTYEEHRRIDV